MSLLILTAWKFSWASKHLLTGHYENFITKPNLNKTFNQNPEEINSIALKEKHSNSIKFL